MFKVRDPLGFVERDPELRALNRRYEKFVKPFCLVLMAAPFWLISIVVLYKTING